jgi:hypothetical protein
MLGSAPANADAVKSGELQWGYTDRTAKSTQSTGVSEPSDTHTSAGSSTDTSNQQR